MRRYETIFIADPDLSDKDQTSLFDKIKTLIIQEKGILVIFDEWGNRQLAYEIKKKTRGYYVCITYGGTGELVTELERNFRLDDRVLKFMTILLEKDIDPEEFHQEKEAEEALNEKDNVKAEDKNNDSTGPEAEIEPKSAVETESAPESGQKEAEKDSKPAEGEE